MVWNYCPRMSGWSAGAALLDWPATWALPLQAWPFAELQISRSLVLLLATNASHSLSWNTASAGAVLLDWPRT